MTSELPECRDTSEVAFRPSETIAEVWRAIGALGHVDRDVRLANRCLRSVPDVNIRITHVMTGPPARRILGSAMTTVSSAGGDRLVVPIRRGKRLVGALRVIVEPVHMAEEPAVSEVLIALADPFAAVIDHHSLEADLAARQRELGLLRQQMEAAAEALVSAGEHLASVSQGLAVGLREASDARSRHDLVLLLEGLAAAKRAYRRGAGALYIGGGPDLPSWLRRLAAELGRVDDTELNVRVRGEPHELAAPVTEAISQLVLQWLLSARIEDRASSVAVLLAYSEGGVCLSIRDDGVGLSHRDVFGTPGGLRSLQRAVVAAGGAFRVRNAEPRGVEVAVGFVRTAKVHARA